MPDETDAGTSPHARAIGERSGLIGNWSGSKRGCNGGGFIPPNNLSNKVKPQCSRKVSCAMGSMNIYRTSASKPYSLRCASTRKTGATATLRMNGLLTS